VLLDSNLLAKISDFGNSRIVPDKKFRKITANPGKVEYMPPEASKRDYGRPLDIFSFGHLSLFVLLQVSIPKFEF
jgi:serine/threonine protein kinase